MFIVSDKNHHLLFDFYFFILVLICAFILFSVLTKSRFSARGFTILLIFHLICLSFYTGKAGAFFLFTILIVFSTDEFLGLYFKRRFVTFLFSSVAMIIALLSNFIVIDLLFIIPIVSVSIVFLLPSRILITTALGISLWVTIVLFGLLALLLLQMNYFNLLIALIVINQFQDTMGLLAGNKYGRISVTSISPNKTLEGYIGALFGNVLAVLVLLWPIPALSELSNSRIIVIMSAVFVSGIAGDLVLSRIKRLFDIKDFSVILPGHGGILDRFDSIIVSAPILYCIAVIL